MRKNINIRKSFVWSFLAMCAFILVAQSVLFVMSSRQEDYSAKINLATRQKIIAQHLVSTLLELRVVSATPEEHVDRHAELQTDLQKWKGSQSALMKGSKLYQVDNNNSPKVQELYQKIAPVFVRMSDVVTSMTGTSSADQDALSLTELLSLEKTYLDGMTEVQALLLSEQQFAFQQIQWVRIVFAGLMLLMVFILYYFLIRPKINRLHIQNRELLESNRVLETIAHQKDASLYQMAEVLVEPANKIVGLAQILEQEEAGSDVRKISRKIRASGEIVMRALQDCADQGKIERGELDLDNERFDLRNALEEVVESVKASMSNRSIELMLDIHSSVGGEIIQDKYRLQQVIQQLLENGIRFTEKGEVVLHVELIREEYSFVQLKFSVRDTGPGFTELQVERIFDGLTIESAGSDKRFSSRSLGLAFSQAIVHKMGGKMWVESKPLHGSTFHFTIVAERSDIPHEKILGYLQGIKALVVDDNKTNLKILVKQLSVWGIQATPFNSPELVAEVLSNLRKFDLCLIDLEMPEMEGRELARRIRLEYPSPDFPLIALSSANKGYISDRENLFSAYLTKPVKQAHLLDVIIESLGLNKKVGEKSHRNSGKEVHLAHGGLKVLIAQDNELMRAVAKKNLNILGCEYEQAFSGKQVLDKVRSGKYDLLLVDLGLPEFDGIETTKRIRESATGKFPPVIIGLSENETRDRGRCIRAGMDDCINYAVPTNELEEKISHFFENEE